MDDIWFVGMAFDEDRAPATSSDVRHLADVLKRRGFSLEDREPASDDGGHPAIHLSWGTFYARVVLDADWLVQVITEPGALQESRDAEVGQRGIDRLIEAIGIATEIAGTYLGCISLDPEDDLTILVEDPPVEIKEPLALIYLGQRYLQDWDVPDFAAAAELDVVLPAGRLIVPDLDELF